MVVEYTSKERFWLWCLSLFSFFTINVAFLYALFFEPDTVVGALRNPVSAAFIVEAFLLMGALSYLLTKWGVSKGAKSNNSTISPFPDMMSGKGLIVLLFDLAPCSRRTLS